MVIDINGIVPTKEILRGLISSYTYSGYLKTFGRSMASMFGMSKTEYDSFISCKTIDQIREWALKEVEKFAMPLEDIVKMFDSAKIDYVCIQNSDEETVTGVKPVPNDYVANVVKEYPDKFIGFACADPLKGNAALHELERAITKLGLSGLTIVPFRNRLYADDERFYPFYAKCVDLGIPVWIHTPNNWSPEHLMDYGNPRRIDHIAVDFPDLRIIAGHGGWPWVLEMVVVAWRHSNVYIDTSAHRPAYFARPGSGWEPLLHFGNTTIKDKVVFGSEWLLLGVQISDIVEEIRQLPLKEEVKQMWLHDNAAKLLNLKAG